MAADWEAIQRALWAAVRAQDGRLEQSTAEFVAAILDAIGTTYALTPEAQQRLADYFDAIDGMIRDGVAQAIEPTAEATMPVESLRDAFIAQETAAAYARRWPDGLRLSDRVWRWQETTLRGVSAALDAGVQAGRAIGQIQMEMQRAIESAAGERFAITTQQTADWAAELYDAARVSIRSKGGADVWHQAVSKAIAHIESLRDGGTRRQAQHALARMREAVAAGRQDLLDEHLRWWIYGRQQYAIRRVVRTEMATASHRAVIATTRDDPLITGYRWRLSGSHPVADICDTYAAVEFGLGAGVFPVDKVPAGKAHPHCMCSLTPTTRRKRKDRVDGRFSEQDLVDQSGGRYQIYVDPGEGR